MVMEAAETAGVKAVAATVAAAMAAVAMAVAVTVVATEAGSEGAVMAEGEQAVEKEGAMVAEVKAEVRAGGAKEGVKVDHLQSHQHNSAHTLCCSHVCRNSCGSVHPERPHIYLFHGRTPPKPKRTHHPSHSRYF